MDRRKKRTSTKQYMMYLEFMEKDVIFATGRIPRDFDSNYNIKKWKELSDKLNTCTMGPTLTPEEWRKRLNDWKNTTRCKYRRSISGEKDISMTSLEMKALDLFGKAPNVATDNLSLHLKSEKEDDTADEEHEHQRTSETFQKELQAAVEEAIGGDDEEDGILDEEHDDHVDMVHSVPQTHTSAGPTTIINSGSSAGAQHNSASSGNGGSSGTTYRTIVVDSTHFSDEDNNDDHLEYITHKRHIMGTSVSTPATVATGVQTSSNAGNVGKLINGDIPLKRFRTNPSEQIIYEVRKAHPPQQTQRSITIHNSGAPSNVLHQQQHMAESYSASLGSVLESSHEVREITRQLKRIADIKAEKLNFEIARFKFNNPGFHYNYTAL